MALSPQTQVIAQLNSLNALAVMANQFILQVGALGYLPDITPVLNALPTAPINEDGSLGKADVQPTASNPIDTRLVAGLNRACTPAQYEALKGYLNAIVGIMNTPQNNGTIAPFLGG